MNSTTRSLQSLSDRFRRFARDCSGESPLYGHLSSEIAADAELLALAKSARPGQPVPNLFLAAVHSLLLAGAAHEVARFYGSCVADPRPPAGAFIPFRDFCLSQEAAIGALVAQRQVQTNEVRRCAYLALAFTDIARRVPGRPLALIDVGTSAGLNLMWDRYAYDYGLRSYGRPATHVRMRCEWRRPCVTLLPDVLPVVSSRVGVDLHVVDVADPAEVLWLRSLVWPDQPGRMELLSAAIGELRAEPPRLIEGDALAVLSNLILEVPETATACVFHCHTLNQFSEAQRDQFKEILAEASRERPVVQVSAEWIRTPSPELKLIWWTQGQSRCEHLANVDHHGRWIEWLAEECRSGDVHIDR